MSRRIEPAHPALGKLGRSEASLPGQELLALLLVRVALAHEVRLPVRELGEAIALALEVDAARQQRRLAVEVVLPVPDAVEARLEGDVALASLIRMSRRIEPAHPALGKLGRSEASLPGQELLALLLVRVALAHEVRLPVRELGEAIALALE